MPHAYANEAELIERTWSEWKRLTRFMQSGGIAFRREAGLWEQLELTDTSTLELSVPTVPGGKGYRVTVEEHRAALADREFLWGAALVLMYSMAESSAREALTLRGQSNDGAIEVWGARLLQSSPYGEREWSGELTVRAAIDLAITRNAVAHGDFRIKQAHIERFQHSGILDAYAVGDVIRLDEATLYRHRDFLRQLLRVSGLQKAGQPPKLRTARRPRQSSKLTRRNRLRAAYDRARKLRPEDDLPESPW